MPSTRNGWLTAILIYCFMASFAVGPGVRVRLAGKLSEPAPTRIRSNGMSIALLVNVAISTTIAGIFLPTVGQYGYSHDVFHLCRLHRGLFHYRHTFFCRRPAKNPGRNRSVFEGKK